MTSPQARSKRTEATLLVKVWRGGADGGFREYEVPRRESQTVLDVVTHIQRALDPTLAYRYACRVGMCGSCAMTVNGAPRWTCRTHVDKVAADGRLARVHARDASWFQWPLLEAAVEGNIVADFPIRNKSFNCSYSGHDL